MMNGDGYGLERGITGQDAIVPVQEATFIYADEPQEDARPKNEVYRAALRWLSGHDQRKQTEIAEELGVTRAAISKIVTEIADKLGIPAGRSSEGREAYAAAASAAHKRRKEKAPAAVRQTGEVEVEPAKTQGASSINGQSTGGANE